MSLRREDGELAASRVVHGGAAQGDFKLRHEGERTCSVTLRDIRIYNRALRAGEIAGC
jgi:hypothetical protein